MGIFRMPQRILLLLLLTLALVHSTIGLAVDLELCQSYLEQANEDQDSWLTRLEYQTFVRIYSGSTTCLKELDAAFDSIACSSSSTTATLPGEEESPCCVGGSAVRLSLDQKNISSFCTLVGVAITSSCQEDDVSRLHATSIRKIQHRKHPPETSTIPSSTPTTPPNEAPSLSMIVESSTPTPFDSNNSNNSNNNISTTLGNATVSTESIISILKDDAPLEEISEWLLPYVQTSMDTLSVQVLDLVLLAETTTPVTRQSSQSSKSSNNNNAQVDLPTTIDFVQPMPCPDRWVCYYISSSIFLLRVTPDIYQDFVLAWEEAMARGQLVELLQRLQSVPIQVGVSEPAPTTSTSSPVVLSPTEVPIISPTEAPTSTKHISDPDRSVSEPSNNGDKGLQTPGIILSVIFGVVTLVALAMLVHARRHGHNPESNDDNHNKLKDNGGGDLILIARPDEPNPEVLSTPTHAEKETDYESIASGAPCCSPVDNIPTPPSPSPQVTVTNNKVDCASSPVVIKSASSQITTGISDLPTYNGVDYGETAPDRPYSRPADPYDRSQIQTSVVYDGVDYSEGNDHVAIHVDYSEGHVAMHDLGEEWSDHGLELGPPPDDDAYNNAILGDNNKDDDDDDLERAITIPTPYTKNNDMDSDANYPSGWDLRNHQDYLPTVSEASECSSRDDP